jgi:hypothetical protein
LTENYLENSLANTWPKNKEPKRLTPKLTGAPAWHCRSAMLLQGVRVELTVRQMPGARFEGTLQPLLALFSYPSTNSVIALPLPERWRAPMGVNACMIMPVFAIGI